MASTKTLLRHPRKARFWVAVTITTVLFLSACKEDDVSDGVEKTSLRGVKTFLVEDFAEDVSRLYPSVLEPRRITAVAFTTGGQITQLDVSVGQVVAQGDVLAQLDTEVLEQQVREAEAVARQLGVQVEDARADLARQRVLLERGTVTATAVDDTTSRVAQLEAQAAQAEAGVEVARTGLDRATLRAPFDGVISAVDVEPFTTVNAGTPIATLYGADSFEVGFSVSFDVVSRLAVGGPARIRLADAPDRVLEARVAEFGSRANTVSSFPVTVVLSNAPTSLKAGMAVEVELDLPREAEEAVLIPLTALLPPDRLLSADERVANVFFYQPDDQTVTLREVTIAGVSGSNIVVLDGLKPGDRVASAGVAYLRDGQAVRLLGEEG